MKATKKKTSGSIKVDPDILKDSRRICLDLEVNIGDYASDALKEKNNKESSKLNKK